MLDPVLNAIIGDVNVNIEDALSGQNIGLTVLDQDGNAVTLPGDCNLSADSLTVDADKGITIGGGSIDGLGGTANPTASAGEANSIAIGNGAATDPGATSAVAIGLRGTVDATDGVALGRDATVSIDGGVALGAGSLADRAGMNGAAEAFSGTFVASTAGAVSVGSSGAERQITNVAGGTADTDAVNVRQLRAVGTNLADALGGGAEFDNTTGIFTGPTYEIRGTSYNDVGSALAALDTTLDVIAANNTSGYGAASAAGDDALATGYGSSAGGDNAAAYGTGASAAGNGSTAIGSGADASYDNSTAIGSGATTTRAGQVVVGTDTNTYTMPGIASAQSTAAQSGPTGVVTTDASGNLASVPVDILGMSDSIDALGALTRAVRREARQGVAAAMAMATAPMPSAPGRTTWASNMATYEGEWATGFAMAHRFDTSKPLAFNASVSLTVGGSPGARAGFVGEF